MKKPETITEITLFLERCIDKALNVTPASFGKFTSPSLPDDYLYNKWISKDKDFSDVYLNMDSENQELFIKYAIPEATEDIYYLSYILRQFFKFCWNWDSAGCENPFSGKYATYLKKQATGKKDPQWITSIQVLKLFKKQDTNGRAYLTWCCFGAKKEEV